MRIKVILVIIFILGLTLRLYNLHIDRPPLYVDEVSHYYYWLWLNTAHSLTLPNLIHTLFSGVFTYTWIFGLTPLGVRLPAAIYGSLVPLAIYFPASSIGKTGRNTELIALTSSLLSVFLPWSFMISRIGHSHIPLVIIFTCLSAGIYLRSTKLKGYLLSLFFLILAAYFYPSVIVIAPFLLIVMVSQIWWQLPKRQQLNLLAVVSVVGIVMLSILIINYSGFSLSGRGLDLAIWRNINVTADMNLYRGIAGESLPTWFSLQQTPDKLAKFFYNYPLAIVAEFTKRYLSFFSPDWLFLKGDPVLRHSTGQMGGLWPILLPFLLIGAFTFFKESDKKAKLWITTWLLASPIPAAITHDGSGYLLRAITLLPLLTYFCALGIWEIYMHLKRSTYKWTYALCLTSLGLYSAAYFFFGYFHVYPALSAESYEHGFKELAQFQQTHQNQTMLIIWPGYYPNHYFRFWQKTSPLIYNKFSVSSQIYGQSALHQTFSNLYFSWPADVADLQLILTAQAFQFLVFPTDYLTRYPEYQSIVDKQLAVINYPDHQVAFTVYTVHKL